MGRRRQLRATHLRYTPLTRALLPTQPLRTRTAFSVSTALLEREVRWSWGTELGWSGGRLMGRERQGQG